MLLIKAHEVFIKTYRPFLSGKRKRRLAVFAQGDVWQKFVKVLLPFTDALTDPLGKKKQL